MPFLQLTNISKSYSVAGQDLQVLENLSVAINKGEMVAIVGASGVGKSTLMNLVGGLDRCDGGQVQLGDENISGMSDVELVRFRNRHVGFVFQFHHLLPEFSALENVEMPLRIADVSSEAASERARILLERVGLSDRLSHRPGMLSGGEQQRVAVARALVMRPSLLLADEPTGDLDSDTADALHNLLREMHADYRLTSVIATHNTRLAGLCDRVFYLEKGSLSW
tara:strand:+ start:14018 stop:14689 length:672 start_codon:yes stop_codon:yes gene_type:complete